MKTSSYARLAVSALAAFALTATVLPVMAAADIKLPKSPSERPQLKSIYSSSYDLEQLASNDERALVFIFLGTHCPVAQQYIPALNAIQDKYRAQGVRLFGVYSDASVQVLDMAVHAHDQDIAFPVFKDVGQRFAKMLEATITPEVVVLTKGSSESSAKNLVKEYQGAIDDQYEQRGRKAAPSKHYLIDALEDILANREVRQAYIRPSGCQIESREPARKVPAGVTYHKDIAPLIAKNCQACHQDGGPGPFELKTYDDVSMNAEKIRETVIDRRMPPWHGHLNPKFGHIRNDKRLSTADLNTLVGWIDAGAPEGEPPAEKAETAPASDPKAWAIGKPDYVYRMPKPFRVPKTGVIDYQFFRVPLDWQADRWFDAVEIKPGASDVVHHITLHVVPAAKGKIDGLMAMAQLYGINGEMGHLINDYVPGDSYNAKVYPRGQGVRIPKHSDLVFEVHYTPNGIRETPDQSMVAFRWAKEPPQEEVLTEVFRKPIGRFRVPPHHPHYRVEDSYYFKRDVLVDAIRPHFHLRGKSFRLEIVERDPDTDEITSTTPILTVPVFDPGWQRTYELETPLPLAAGAELRVVGHFDNSAMNPNNPNPNLEVSWGQQTTDEMFSTRFKYRLVPNKDGHVPKATPTDEVNHLKPGTVE